MFDWTISLGNILTFIGLLGSGFFGFWRLIKSDLEHMNTAIVEAREKAIAATTAHQAVIARIDEHERIERTWQDASDKLVGVVHMSLNDLRIDIREIRTYILTNKT